jgi:hypothetical protein
VRSASPSNTIGRTLLNAFLAGSGCAVAILGLTAHTAHLNVSRVSIVERMLLSESRTSTPDSAEQQSASPQQSAVHEAETDGPDSAQLHTLGLSSEVASLVGHTCSPIMLCTDFVESVPLPDHLIVQPGTPPPHCG